MIEGELYQLTKTGDASITEEEHFEIIRRKTAYLFSGCAEIGGLLGHATPDQRTALREYGFNLGIAFQIVDDVLDYMAEESALGKPIGGDLREGKVTLPIILLLQRAGPEVAELIQSVIADGQVTPETLARRSRTCSLATAPSKPPSSAPWPLCGRAKQHLLRVPSARRSSAIV